MLSSVQKNAWMCSKSGREQRKRMKSLQRDDSTQYQWKPVDTTERIIHSVQLLLFLKNYFFVVSSAITGKEESMLLDRFGRRTTHSLFFFLKKHQHVCVYENWLRKARSLHGDHTEIFSRSLVVINYPIFSFTHNFHLAVCEQAEIFAEIMFLRHK